MASKVQRVARVLPIAADPLALPLQVLAVLAVPIFGIVDAGFARAVCLAVFGALAAFALIVGVEARHQRQLSWGDGAMWIVLGGVLAADAALMFHAVALR